jgi:hypothetical protein
MKRPIPNVNIKEYATPGTIGIYPGKDELRIEVDKCTLFPNMEEALSIGAALMDAGYKTWGNDYLDILMKRFADL